MTVAIPLFLHACAVEGTASALLRIDDKESDKARLLRQIMAEQYQLALSRIHADISIPTFQPTDAYIHAISMLAVFAGVPKDFSHRNLICYEPYPLSPVGGLQTVYTRWVS